MSRFRDEEPVDLQAWDANVRGIKTRDQHTERKVYEREQEHNEAVAARGGTITSSMSEEATKALTTLKTRRDRDIRAFVESKRPAIEAQHRHLLTDAASSGAAYAEAQAALRRYELATNAFLRGAEQPLQPEAADADAPMRVADFQRRTDRILNPPAQPASRLSPLPRPDFAALVN